MSSEDLSRLLQRYLKEDTFTFAGCKQIQVNTKGVEMHTPLHMAVIRGVLEDVDLLIHGGADVNAEDDIGMTPLLFAVIGGDPKLIEMLLGAGARADWRNRFGETASSLASGIHSDKIKDLLQNEKKDS
jgi:uncharacterized protein